jgi:hypothetical protein
MKLVRIILFVLIFFLALPEFAFGIPSLLNGLRALGDVWSVQHNYFGDAAVVLVPAMFAIFLAYWGAFRAQKLNWLYSLVATGIVLLMAAAIPSWITMPKERAAAHVKVKIYELARAAEMWAEEKGAYPLTDAELAEALQRARLGGNRDSLYQRKGTPVPYETTVVASAVGPVLRSERPAVIYYGVAADGRRYWITGTALPAEISESVVSVGEHGRSRAFIATGDLDPPSPAMKPAAATK